MPSVPRSDTRETALDGPHSESPVCVPKPAAAKEEATAVAVPPDEPIGDLDGSYAFHTWP